MGTLDQNAAKAAALDNIIEIIGNYLPPDSGVFGDEALSEIIGLIETRGLYKFLEIELER